ncbi:MAG: glycogen debranching protein GlgX [Sphingobium phenoxybenzoativorans]
MNPGDLPPLGPRLEKGGTRFTVWSAADALSLCLFEGDREERLPMEGNGQGLFTRFVAGIGAGASYGLRAVGSYDPASGLWFDPSKLLLDPYATAIDRPFIYDPRLAEYGHDTAALMPKGVIKRTLPARPHQPPKFTPGGLIYELQVRAFSKLHPAVPPKKRGTIAALAHPAVIDHLKKLHVSAVELMPINAWIDERHLGPLGLTNAWGYNPVSYFALDPRLAPGGLAELRATVDALHDAGIGVIMDVVFNHDGESDALGPTLSLRGLDARRYFRHEANGALINDTGTGNSVDCNNPVARRLILDSLRHFVRHAGIDGFRFDLAPALGRLPGGFDPAAPLLLEMAADPILADRIMIAEPWDIGPGGYQLGNFADTFLEWTDRYRDDLRSFWRGDAHRLGALATRLAGSSDIFGKGDRTRSVNFLAAHDGFSLADVTAYEHRHNEANGEHNRDGHGENLSWNNGVEGETGEPDIIAARQRDVKALLSTLFASRGTIMLTAGDEFGRTQQGNNNAYAQDNAITWLDWKGRDLTLEAHSFACAAQRAATPALMATRLLTPDDVQWLRPDGGEMTDADWNRPDGDALVMRYRDGPAICVNRSGAAIRFTVEGIEPFDVAARSVRLV